MSPECTMIAFDGGLIMDLIEFTVVYEISKEMFSFNLNTLFEVKLAKGRFLFFCSQKKKKTLHLVGDELNWPYNSVLIDL